MLLKLTNIITAKASVNATIMVFLRNIHTFILHFSNLTLNILYNCLQLWITKCADKPSVNSIAVSDISVHELC